MVEILEKYKLEMKVNGKAEHTIRDYMSRVSLFLKEVSIENINEETLKAYLLNLQGKYKFSTINKHRETLMNFLEFIGKEIKFPKILPKEERIKEDITPEFFENEVIPTARIIFKNPKKVVAILYFLFYTGLRRGEVALLKREDINLKQDTFKVYMPKSRREKYGVFTTKTKHIIEDYFKTEPEIDNAFNTTGQAIEKIFQKLQPHFKDLKVFNARLFRHSFATMCRNKEMGIIDMKEAMGHKSIATTEIYAHNNLERQRRIYKEKIEGKNEN